MSDHTLTMVASKTCCHCHTCLERFHGTHMPHCPLSPPPPSEQEQILYEALHPLSDLLDQEEGPVILAWTVKALASALDDRLAVLGYELRLKACSVMGENDG